MLRAILFSLAGLAFNIVSSQTRKSIELSVIGRYDQHANYTSNFGGRAYTDKLRLYGMSYGASIGFRQKINKTLSASVNVGYYKKVVDKIRGPLPFNIPGERRARNIDYSEDITALLHSTSKYHYNNLVISIGLSKTVQLKQKLHLDFGAEVSGYYSFSQRYLINSRQKKYATSNSKPLEFGVNTTLGVLKEYKKIYIRPAIIIPVYQNLKGDKVFYEDRHMNISKWFSGAGLSLRIGKYL